MRERGTLYAGVMLIAFGGLFLVAQVGGVLLRPLGVDAGWGALWPLIVLLVGFGFWLPLLIWWNERDRLAGFVIPGTIISMNGLILLYQNLTGDWESWSYLWTLEPFAVGVGLLLLYLIGPRERGLLVGASVVGGVGVLFFVIFASVFGGVIRFLGPIVLVAVGALVLIEGVRRRVAEDGPR